MDWQEKEKLEKEAIKNIKPAAPPIILHKKNVDTRKVTLPKSKDIAKLAESATPHAIQALIDIATDDTATASARVSAANAILDRAHGKPHTSIDVNQHIKVEPISVAEAARKIAYALNEAASEGVVVDAAFSELAASPIVGTASTKKE